MGKDRNGVKFNDWFPFYKLYSLLWIFGAFGIGMAVTEAFRVSVLESLLPIAFACFGLNTETDRGSPSGL